MNCRQALAFLCVFVFVNDVLVAQTGKAPNYKAWQPAAFRLSTPWSEQVQPDNVLEEYPRPQMKRSKWVNLNGLWDYAVTDSSISTPPYYQGQILVPFPMESALSGVKKVLASNQKIWYKRSLTLSSKNKTKKYLLHFGAVDYACTVWVNGKVAGSHAGGYLPFSFDISNALKSGNNELLVAVTDPTDNGNNPRGKQTLQPQGIMYTPCSGIWQTVWMEELPVEYIQELRLTPNVDKRQLEAEVITNTGNANLRVELVTQHSVVGKSGSKLVMTIDTPHLWSPDDPYLYDVVVRLYNKDKLIDSVQSYFGMRKISIANGKDNKERIFLNNNYLFNLGLLDQGYWPDGIYTAPTDEALKFDILAAKKMGFNSIRKHIKVEPARWYYWCDKLGILVWQDMPQPGSLSTEGKAVFEAQNKEIVHHLYNHPSIVTWVLFNEGWNRFDQERLTNLMRAADPTRIVDGHTGENYDRGAPHDPGKKWIGSQLTDVHVYPGPGIPPNLTGKARVLGEWGGIRVITRGHQWDTQKSWGYAESDQAAMLEQYSFSISHLKLFEEEGLSAAFYTQTVDVESEENGFITYDRKIFKIDAEKIKQVNKQLFH